ncbi:MAG: 50S ribosomal protein L18 [Patescibacteria group bacterium]|jgi:large subunit ribosomal protein L18|nr:50S ribosomal protein L18 [Patescibacteria group bacterium]
MSDLKHKQQRKIRRKKRVRAKISGTASKPRLNVFRSLKHLYVQLIDDQAGKTLVAVKDSEIKDQGTKTELAAKVGELLAKKAQAAGIIDVVFDKSSSKYHGRVKAVADGARQAGLKF